MKISQQDMKYEFFMSTWRRKLLASVTINAVLHIVVEDVWRKSEASSYCDSTLFSYVHVRIYCPLN